MPSSRRAKHTVLIALLWAGSASSENVAASAEDMPLSLFDFLGTMVEDDEGWIDPLDMQGDIDLLNQGEQIPGQLLFGIDDDVDAENLQLVSQSRVLHPGNLARYAEASSGMACQHVYCVIAGDGDQELGLVDAGRFENRR